MLGEDGALRPPGSDSFKSRRTFQGFVDDATRDKRARGATVDSVDEMVQDERSIKSAARTEPENMENLSSLST